MPNYFIDSTTLPAATFSSNLVLVVQSNRTDLAKLAPAERAGSVNLSRIARFFEKCAKGAFSANVFVMAPTPGVGSGIGLSHAAGTITIDNPANAKTVSIAGNTLTCATTPSSEVQFQASTDATSQISTAVSLCNLINDYHPLCSLLAATNNASNIVNVVSRVPGVIGNSIAISCGDEWATASGSTLEGGSNVTMGIIAAGM